MYFNLTIFHSSSGSDDKDSLGKENPISRTARVLGQDLSNLRKKVFGSGAAAPTEHDPNFLSTYDQWQSHCDIAIIGGGVVGSSIAYWIQQRVPKAVNIVVLEKDPSVSFIFSCKG